MESVTSSGIGGIARPVINAATKTAQAAKVKSVKVKVKVGIKKKMGKNNG